MAKLFIANATHQRREVFYRLDVDKSGSLDPNDQRRAPRKITVEPGRQVFINDLHSAQATSIIEQLARIGATSAGDGNRFPRGRSVPYVLNVDSYVPKRLLEQAHAHNKGVLTQSGADRRKRAAVAANDVVKKHVEESDATLKAFEVGVEEQPPEPGEERSGKLLEEGIIIEQPTSGKKTKK